MSTNTPVRLRVPRQDQQEFEFFPLTAEGAQHWSEGLPVADDRQVAQQLRPVIDQLNRVEIAPELRYHILEALRPGLLVATAGLSRRFLKQPLIMPEEPRQMAELADSLYTLAGTGYTLVAVHAIQRKDAIREMNPARLVCESLQRAIRFAGAKLLQTFQLYRPVELHGWLSLHQLYALAEAQQLAGLKVVDTLSGSGTITTAYLQALLLGCSKPNQLRQGDLATIYRGLQDWSALLSVDKERDSHSLFLVDLDNDQPPLYSSLYHEAPGPRTRYLDTGPLVAHLEQLRDGAEKQGVMLDKDTVIPHNLLEHMISALGSMSMRNFTRGKTTKTMWVSLGLGASHYYLAGEQTFERLVYGDDYIPPAAERIQSNPFLERHDMGDLWQQANPEEDFTSQEFPSGEGDLAHTVQVDQKTLAALQGEEEPELPPRQRYPVHRVVMSDASPGGYCLEWTAQLPGSIKTGDIVCLREDEDSQWAVAVIRWMSQLENAKTLIGLELLSPGAKAYGARMHRKKGEETDLMRVLLLPEIPLVGQPHTLITPRAGFRERQKIILMRKGEEFFIQLLRQVTVTGSFMQFDFRYIKQLGEVLAEDKSRPQDSAFDSLWTNI